MSGITVTFLSDMTDRLGRDKETGRIDAYFFECARGDLRVEVAVSALEAQQAAWRTVSQPVLDAAEQMAVVNARSRFDAFEAGEERRKGTARERQRQMQEYRRRMAEWTEARVRGELPPHPVRPHTPGRDDAATD